MSNCEKYWTITSTNGKRQISQNKRLKMISDCPKFLIIRTPVGYMSRGMTLLSRAYFFTAGRRRIRSSRKFVTTTNWVTGLV